MTRVAFPNSPDWVTSYHYIPDAHVQFAGIDVTAWYWTSDAACAGIDSDLFFETDGRMDNTYLSQLCGHCPVKAACLEHALDHDEHGWWAGTTRNQRLRLQRRAARG